VGRLRTALLTASLLLFLTVASFAQTVLSSTEITIDGKKYKIDVILTPVTPPPPTAPATPQDLAATPLSPTEVKLTWKDVSTDEGAFVFYRKTGTAAFARIGDSPPNTTAWTDKTAQPGVTYQYQMLAWNPGGGASKGSNIVTVTTPVPPPQPPLAPTALAATVISPTQVNLTWLDNSTDETEFGIYRKSGTGDWARVSGTLANVTSFEDKSVVAGTAYIYRVQAVKDTLISGWSNEVLITTPLPPPTPPVAPTVVTAVAKSPTQVTVSWNDLNNDETGFEVYRSQGSAGGWTKVITLAANVGAYFDTTVAGTTYQYRVRVLKGNLFADSPVATVTTAAEAPPPGTPTGLTATAASPTQVNLAWVDNSTDETGFDVYRKSATSDWARIGGVQANVASYQDKTAAATTAYTYKVIVLRNGLGFGWSNDAAVTTPQPSSAAPIPPSAFNSFALSPTEMSVNWNDLDPEETGYEVYRSEENSGTFVKIATVPANVTSYVDAKVKGDTSYTYKVRTVKGAQFSAYSPSSGWRTPRAYPPMPAVLSDGSLYGAMNAGGEAIRDGRIDEVVTFLGTDLGSEGTLTVAGVPAKVLSWTDSRIEAVLPPVPVYIGGKVVATPKDRKPIQSLFDFWLMTGAQGEPEIILWKGQYIDAYADLKGNELKIFRTGQKIMITGYHFGKSGRFFLGAWEIPTVSWSDQQIVVELPNSPNMYHDVWVTVGNPPNDYLTTGAGFRILPPE
jgi:fibronectin type 3 domain-containing protein